MRPFFPDDEELTVPGQWFAQSRAYLDASLELLGGFQSGRLEPSWYRLNVVGFALFHSVELLLKGALEASGQRPRTIHRFSALYGAYKTAFPGNESDFTFRIVDLVNADPARPWEHFFKYPVSAAGDPWPFAHQTVEVWLEQSELLRQDFERLLPLFRAAEKARVKAATASS